MNESNGKDISLLTSFAAGSVGGMCFLVVGYPFDTIKARHLIVSRIKMLINV